MGITRLVIYPYKISSESACAFRDYFKTQGWHSMLVYPNRAYLPTEGDVIIDWGMSKSPEWKRPTPSAIKIINRWTNVDRAIDKFSCLGILKDKKVSIPSFSNSAITAKKWLNSNEGSVVYGRELLRGMRGKGICLLYQPSDFQTIGEKCKFYTFGQKVKSEYRVYVIGDKCVDVLEKRRARHENDPGLIRSEENGWVFCRQHVNIPQGCIEQAIMAVKALGLDFGGVDVIWTWESTPVVLEVNTAPEIFGSGIFKFGKGLLDYGKTCSGLK